jgi:hypothetical protein
MESSTDSRMKYGKLGALGAVGVALGLVALYAFMVWVNRPGPTAGEDQIHAVVAWISILVPVAAIIAIHLTFARILWGAANGKRWTH